VDGKIISLDIPASENILIKIKNSFKRWQKLRGLKKNNYHASISILDNANILNPESVLVMSKQFRNIMI